MSFSSNKVFSLYKDAWSGHPREIWLLVIVTFINRLGTMVFPFLTVYLTAEKGFSLGEAGFLAGAFGAGSLAGSWSGGKLCDKIGENRVIFFSLSISGILLILLQFAGSFSSIMLMIFLSSMVGESYRPALMVAAGKYVGSSETGRTMSFLRLAISLGMSVAPALGGFVISSFGYSWLFNIDGATCLAGAIYFLLFRPAKSSVRKMEPGPEKKEDQNFLPEKKKIEIYPLFLLSTFIGGFIFIQWFHTVPVFLKSAWGFDEKIIGIILGSHSLIIALFEMPIIHTIEKRKKISASVIAGIVFIGSSFFPFLFPAAITFAFLAMLIWTSGNMLYIPLNNSIAMNICPSVNRGKYIGRYWMMWSLTNITGPLFGFHIAESAGFSTFWIILTAITIPALFLFVRLQKNLISGK